MYWIRTSQPHNRHACVTVWIHIFLHPYFPPAWRHVSIRYCIPDTFILHDTCKQGCTISAHRWWEAVKLYHKPLQVLAFCRRFSSITFTVSAGWSWTLSRNTQPFYQHKRNSRHPLGFRTSPDTVASTIIRTPIGRTPDTVVFPYYSMFTIEWALYLVR